jgi:hypothetical protein
VRVCPLRSQGLLSTVNVPQSIFTCMPTSALHLQCRAGPAGDSPTGTASRPQPVHPSRQLPAVCACMLVACLCPARLPLLPAQLPASRHAPVLQVGAHSSAQRLQPLHLLGLLPLLHTAVPAASQPRSRKSGHLPRLQSLRAAPWYSI